MSLWGCIKCGATLSFEQKRKACIHCGGGIFYSLPEKETTTPASPNGAVRSDTGKLDWDLVPWEQLEEVVRVLMGDGPDKGGAAQYGRSNWKKGKGDQDFHLRTRNSLIRHVIAYARGERKDPVTGLHPLAHAVCNCLFLMFYDSNPN